jgi:hypothetical protein
VLAVGSEDGTVSLHEVENGDELQKHTNGRSPIVSLEWAAVGIATDSGTDGSDDAEYPSPPLEDRIDAFLPECPPLPEGNMDLGVVPLSTIRRSLPTDSNNTDSNVLVVGAKSGSISLYALGALLIGELELDGESEFAGHALSLAHATLSKDIATLTAICDVEGTGRLVRHFQTQLICDRRRELHGIALQCSHVTALIQHLGALIRCMQNAWESILLELNTKLATFAKNSEGQGTLSLEVEFMSLLTSGIQSPELEGFLSRELSTRKLKTMGASVEGAYSSIQQLVVEHMNQVTQALMFRIGDLEGLACWEERFEPVGLDVAAIQECTTMLGSFALKSAELLNAIDESKSSFNAFFSWLQRVMWLIENADGQAPNFKFDTAQVAKFITDNFSSLLPSKEDGQAMVDVVGQYFAPSPLRTVQNAAGDWDELFREIVLDSPAGGCHAQVVRAIELGPAGGIAPGALKSKLREQGIAGEAVDDAVSWLMDKGSVVVPEGSYVLALADAPGQTQHTHLYPDVASSSLAQVLVNLEARVQNSFSLTATKCQESFSATVGACMHTDFDPTLPSAVHSLKTEDGEFQTFALSVMSLRQVQVVKVAKSRIMAASVIFDDTVEVRAIEPFDDESFAVLLAAPTTAEEGSSTECALVLIPFDAVDDTYEVVDAGGSVAEVLAQQEPCDGHAAITKWHELNMDTAAIAVEGRRTTGCALSQNGRVVKLYILDDGEEDESSDEEDSDDVEGGEDGEDDEQDDAANNTSIASEGGVGHTNSSDDED